MVISLLWRVLFKGLYLTVAYYMFLYSLIIVLIKRVLV